MMISKVTDQGATRALGYAGFVGACPVLHG